jgi:hypothetical protein
MNDDEIDPSTAYTFKAQDDFVKKFSNLNVEISHKDERAEVAATLAVDLALDNKDYEGLYKALDNDLVNYKRLSLNNTKWLDREDNESLFLLANDHNVEQTNEQLTSKGFSPIPSQENISERSRSVSEQKGDNTTGIEPTKRNTKSSTLGK